MQRDRILKITKDKKEEKKKQRNKEEKKGKETTQLLEGLQEAN
jgi:hypothetical protein